VEHAAHSAVLEIMNGHRDWGSSEEHQPVTWLGGYALYAAHFIVLLFVVAMLATTIMMAIPASRGMLGWLTFRSDQVLAGEVWRVFTYGLVNEPSLGFVIRMFMLGFFGRELEKYFGRRTFLTLYGSLYFLTPVLFTLIGFLRPMPLAGESAAFALFIAFATLYPNVPLLFNILAKWMAIALVGIYTLMLLAANEWPGLIALWSTVAFAFCFVRYQQGVITLPKFRLPTRKPKLRVLPDPVSRKATPTSGLGKENATMAEVDALLDKIATSGISSLTAKERAKLEAAREGLMKRGAGRG
jgi:membrane associated rhomboid family serine protease